MQGIHPLNLDVASPPQVARWRALVNVVLVIPSVLWLFVLTLGVAVVSVLGWFAILLTGRLPDSWSDYIMGVLRYQWRVNAYLFWLTDRYPDFNPPAGHIDPGDYPAILYCARPLERDRVTVGLRLVLVIPHLVVLYILGLVGAVVLLIAGLAVLVMGQWPAGLRPFAVGLFRWSARVQAYLHLVTDEYPPFGFEA